MRQAHLLKLLPRLIGRWIHRASKTQKPSSRYDRSTPGSTNKSSRHGNPWWRPAAWSPCSCSSASSSSLSVRSRSSRRSKSSRLCNRTNPFAFPRPRCNKTGHTPRLKTRWDSYKTRAWPRIAPWTSQSHSEWRVRSTSTTSSAISTKTIAGTWNPIPGFGGKSLKSMVTWHQHYSCGCMHAINNQHQKWHQRTSPVDIKIVIRVVIYWSLVPIESTMSSWEKILLYTWVIIWVKTIQNHIDTIVVLSR